MPPVQAWPDSQITGGLAADGSRFRRTWLAQAGRQQPNIVSAVGFYGDRIRVGHGCSAGWSDFGPERRITRAEGNVLYDQADAKGFIRLFSLTERLASNFETGGNAK